MNMHNVAGFVVGLLHCYCVKGASAIRSDAHLVNWDEIEGLNYSRQLPLAVRQNEIPRPAMHSYRSHAFGHSYVAHLIEFLLLHLILDSSTWRAEAVISEKKAGADLISHPSL
jgi:hypothetical protein